MFSVVEDFLSINGEGKQSGKLAVFVRFAGCNLACGYCDTKWANLPNAPQKQMNLEEVVALINAHGIKRVTLTGGEPLLQTHIYELINRLTSERFDVEIETNGSVPLEIEKLQCRQNVSFTMDYKLDSSGMESKMEKCNLKKLTKQDVLKFVVGNQSELDTVVALISVYGLEQTTNVYMSPVYNGIEPSELVAFLKENSLEQVTMQLQLHKLIWGFDSRGC